MADSNALADFVAAHSEEVAAALAGAPLPVCADELSQCQADLTAALACGNGVADPGEDCDIGDLGTGTCVTEGFDGGTLACSAGCVYDTSGCTTWKRVFVTSTRYTGALGGLSGADATCQARADGASGGALGGTWVAWLSTGTVNAKDRITDAPYRLVDGVTIVTASKTDLLDGSLLHAIDLDENGAVVTSNTIVHTGTLADGTAHNRNCNGWTDGNVASTWAGRSQATDAGWTSSPDWTGACNNQFRLYCFQQ